MPGRQAQAAQAPPDVGPRLRGKRAKGRLPLLLGLLFVVISSSLVVTTALSLKNSVRVVQGFMRDRALTLLRGIRQSYRQARGDRSVLARLAREIDDEEVLLLEFFSPDHGLIATSEEVSEDEAGQAAQGSLPPEVFAMGLGRETELLLRDDVDGQDRLEVWALLRPRRGWRGTRGWHGPPGRGRGWGWGWGRGRWRRGPGPWWRRAGGRDGAPPLAPQTPEPGRSPRWQPGWAEPGPGPGPGPGSGSPTTSSDAGPGPFQGPRWAIAHMLISTRAEDRMLMQAYLHAVAVAAELLLLLVVGGLWLALQRRSERLSRELHEQERLAALGSLSAVLAHEIRNPLASVKGHAQFALESVPLQDPQREGLEVIVSESTRLEGLVSSLLDFARPRPLRPRPVPAQGMVEQAFRARRRELESQGLTVQLELDAQDLLVMADPEAMDQVLHKLILVADLDPTILI